MHAFQELLHTAERLLGPDGCPWDRTQTMHSTRNCIVEESSELIDAINAEDNENIREELGDLFFVILFMCKLAEKEKRCTLKEVLEEINTKLIRRHPHVFGDAKLHSNEDVMKQWYAIKQKEKGKENRKSPLDDIPKELPTLMRAQKMYKKLKMQVTKSSECHDEESLGNALLTLVAQAQDKGLDAELALRKTLHSFEREQLN